MKNKARICDIILSAILFLVPFLHVNIGLSVADQGYNLANFEMFPHMNQTWMIATLVANLVGKIFTLLPFGHYMVGMNVYCTLLLSAISVLLYFILKKDYNKYSVFIGLLIAVFFSWAPKVTLYQYLSYYLFCIVALILVKGLFLQKRKLLYIAGVLLGLNLFVRFPNITQAMLIIVVPFYAVLYKREIKEVVKDIIVCIAGYGSVVIPVILVIELLCGKGTYIGMVHGLFAMTEQAASYTPFSMVSGMYTSYLEGIKWFKWFLLEMVIFTGIYGFLRKKWQKYCSHALLALGFVVILRIYWYWGVLNIRYTEYTSVYIWGVCFLLMSILLLLAVIVWPKYEKNKKVYALTVLVIIFITPLGSNNVLYSNFNNLYLVAPVVIGTLTDILAKQKDREKSEKKRLWNVSAVPTILVGYMLVGLLLVQTGMFHAFFVFGDEGINGNKKYIVQGNEVLTGIYTTEANAEEFSNITAYMEQERFLDAEYIVWGHSPVLFYALELDCAIGHIWPTLDSYSQEEMEEDIAVLDEYPIIIYESRYYSDLFDDSVEWDDKTKMICQLLKNGEYTEVYRGDYYAICIPGK
ncbi:MAG: hypothetical protein J6A73_02605 [Lachnospiraceae bacterium]|nr:hypothetical protein [Lachnospiraceae bacterium]